MNEIAIDSDIRSTESMSDHRGATDDGGDNQTGDLTVVALSKSKAEAKAILDDTQYCEAVGIIKRQPHHFIHQ